MSLSELGFSVGNEGLDWPEVNQILGDDSGEGSPWLYERFLNLEIAEELKNHQGARRYEQVESR